MAAPRLPAAAPAAAALALVLVAWCNPARAGSGCAGHDHAAEPAPAVAGTAGAQPAGVAFAPYDPATFVGPPVPIGILFAPAMAPATGGLLYELEGPERERMPVRSLLVPAAVAPARLRMLWDPDVQAELREVPAPGGGYMVDLRGAFLDLATITIAGDGRPVLECVQQPRAAAGPAARPAPRPRAGRE